MNDPDSDDVKDGERSPLMTRGELRDACLHNAATIVIAVELGCEFKDCRLDDDGCKWPTSISSVDLKYPKSWHGAEVSLLSRRSMNQAARLSQSAWPRAAPHQQLYRSQNL